MTTLETRRYEMLVRVRDFGEAHRDLFPDSSVGGQVFAAVAAAVTQLSEHAVSKMSTAREGEGTRTLARAALVERLDAISRTARVIAEDTPGFDDPFRLPQRRHRTDPALLTAGRVFVYDAEACKDRFVAHGMPQTFVTDLTALVETFEQAIRGREAGRDGQTAAKAGITTAVSSGLAAVRKLDVIVANQLHADPVTMAVWERDRRIDYPHRAKSAAAALPSLPAPSASLPPVPSAAPAAPATMEPVQPSAADVAARVAS